MSSTEDSFQYADTELSMSKTGLQLNSILEQKDFTKKVKMLTSLSDKPFNYPKQIE